MNFGQRLLRFLLGVLIGVILCGFFFKDKAHLFTSWLPGQRVKDRIIATEWTVAPTFTSIYACLTDGDAQDSFRQSIDEANVLFSESDTQVEPKIYQLEMDDGMILRFEMTNDTLAQLQEIRLPKASPCHE